MQGVLQRPGALRLSRGGHDVRHLQACNGVGLCNVKPDDDMACGTIDCDSLDTSCLNYHDLTTLRCASLGVVQGAEHGRELHRPSPTCARRHRRWRGWLGGGGRGGVTGTDAGTDAGGGGGGGGGGCCQVGGGPTPDGLVALLVLGLAFVSRRRRR